MEKPTQIKRTPRVDLRLGAVVVDSTKREIKVVVMDISSGGFRLKTDEPLSPGEKVSLLVPPHGEFLAQIRWALETEAGGEFLEPVDLSRL